MTSLRTTAPHGRRSALLTLSYLLTALLVAASPVDSQQRARLYGLVRDSAGVPVPLADVGVVASRKLTKTDDGGLFRLDGLPAGTVEVSIRKLGYQPVTVTHVLEPAATDTLIVALTAHVAVLEGIEVNERNMRRLFWIEDFYRRRARGIGTYITRDDVLARHATRLSDVFRNTPGIRFVRVQGGTGIRFVSAPIHRRDCVPMIWLDGQRAPGMEVDQLQVNEIEGIELYHGPSTTPMQFSQGAITTCGTIVIWSRVPGS